MYMYIPFKKMVALHLNKTWIPFTQGYFVPGFVKNQLKWITIFLYVEENGKIKLTQKTASKLKHN